MFGFLRKRLKEEVKSIAKNVTVRELEPGDVVIMPVSFLGGQR